MRLASYTANMKTTLSFSRPGSKVVHGLDKKTRTVALKGELIVLLIKGNYLILSHNGYLLMRGGPVAGGPRVCEHARLLWFRQ